MGNAITLTEQTLRNIVSDCIDAFHYKKEDKNSCNLEEIISYQLFKRGFINEMAFKRKDFIFHISALRCQLIENWSLCAYCSLYDKTNKNFSHWESEFIAHADNIKKCKLKDGDKKSVIHRTYIDTFDLNEPSMIEQIIYTKFIKENISQNLIKTISHFCASSTETLINFLANDNYPSDEYVIRTFETN